MGASGGTAVAIVFALGAVVVWTGIYFVHKWTGRRGRQVGKTRGNYGRGMGRLAVQSGLLAIPGTLLTNPSHLIINAFFSSTKPTCL